VHFQKLAETNLLSHKIGEYCGVLLHAMHNAALISHYVGNENAMKPISTRCNRFVLLFRKEIVLVQDETNTHTIKKRMQFSWSVNKQLYRGSKYLQIIRVPDLIPLFIQTLKRLASTVLCT
jgi:hypothetical protein